MAITKSIDDLNIIAKLADEPNDVGGLTPAQLKAKFDEGAITLQTFINNMIDALSSTTLNSSGSEQIGSAPVNGVAGSTVYAQIASLKGVIDSMVLGLIPLGSIGIGQLNFVPATEDELTLKADQIYSYTNRIRSYMGV